MSQPVTDLVLAKTNELLEQLKLQATATVTYDDVSGYYQVQIDTDVPGLLIGYRGDTLAALQLILGHQVNRLTDAEEKAEDKTWHKVIVNVGDYRQRREETLTQLAHNAAQRVTFSGESYTFDQLSPAERRIVHLTLQDHPEVTTQSEGEGKHRRLVVVKK